MRAVNRFNVTHFWNPHVLRIPNWYGTCLGQKIFTIGLPAECAMSSFIKDQKENEKEKIYRC